MPDPQNRLPRRDIILLPLLSLLTCAALFVFAEFGARIGWPEAEDDSCVITDQALGFRFKPNCDSRAKAMEGPWVSNHYNACGYRTDQDCGVRKEGVLRVNLMGSSTAEGYLIPYESTVGATLEGSLSHQCDVPVQVENMGMIGYQGDIILTQMDEALALKPDAIVYLVTPFDFDLTEKPTAADAAPQVEHVEPLRRLRNYLAASRAAELAQHFMFTDSERFGTLYLTYGDRADFMRPPFTPAWQKRLTNLDALLDGMQRKASAAGVKLILAYVPSRAQAVFLSSKHRPENVEPFAFGRAVGEIAARHGVGYFDSSDMFAQIADSGALFYPHNGHLTSQGQPLVGQAIARQIIESAKPFKRCLQTKPAETMLGTPSGAISR
jgi:hypothetical protein